MPKLRNRRAARPADDEPWARAYRVVAERAWWLLAPALVAIAYRTATRTEFVGDAEFLIAGNRYLAGLEHLWGNLTHDYFWSSAGTKVPYWRPVTKVAWLLEHQLFGSWAGGYALVQLAWHLVAVVGVELLAVAFGLRRGLAIISGLVFGLHPASFAPVCMLMARSDVVCVAACVWAVLSWWYGRQRDGRWRGWAVIHVVAVMLAIGSKETAVVLPGLLACFSVLLGDTHRGVRGRLWWLLPSVLAVAAYLPLRTHLLGAEATGLAAVGVRLNPLRLVASLAMYLTDLVPFALRSGVRNLPVAEARSAGFWWGHGVGWVGAGALLALGLWRRNRIIVGGLLWALVVLAPVLVVANISVPAIDAKFPLDDRWLYHALAPAALVWAAALGLVSHAHVQRLMELAAATWAAVMLWRAPAAHHELSTLEGMLDNEDRAFYYATPERFRTNEDHCRFHERRMERAIRHEDDDALVSAFADLRERCTLVPPGRWSQAFGALLRQRRHALVLQWLRETGAKDGIGCDLRLRIAEALRAQDALTAAAEVLEQAFACGGQRDASIVLAAATLWLDAGNPSRAGTLLRVARAHDALTEDQRAQASYLERRMSGKGDPGPSWEPVLRQR